MKLLLNEEQLFFSVRNEKKKTRKVKGEGGHGDEEDDVSIRDEDEKMSDSEREEGDDAENPGFNLNHLLFINTGKKLEQRNEI